ncbi:hypothetical protein N7462_009787 [Penicillium macrosclerotiorum]|uniref:uncharacterized protein n=1 Tax=Penicillium macrosclerotiorum TaxID=303699 RepID=UPI002546A8CC|nr:uncharacterized protein N7462_009787 [Penicillium macrosclerotiorum]KAJ5668717.1 hypothetical protein N7462_009787 [Penicillium macrosclerotiorum]
MHGSFLLLLGVHLSQVVCQPYAAPTAVLDPSETTGGADLLPTPTPTANAELNIFDARDGVIVARATSETSESTTSTTSESTTTSTTTSDSSTTSTTTSSTTSSTTTSTTTTTTSSTSSSSTTGTTSSSSTSSSTTTTSSSTTTTTAATATSSSSAELAEWNRKGNIAAIVFSCCLISLFSGVSILHCVRDWAKQRRIAARELMNASSAQAVVPIASSKHDSTANLIADRSSVATFRDSPFGDPRPQTAQSSHHDWNANTDTHSQNGLSNSSDLGTASHENHQHQSLV